MDEQQVTTIDALKKYVATQAAIEEFKAANRAVFNTFEQLGKSAHQAMNDVEDAAAVTGLGADYNGYSVVIKPQTQTYLDAETFRQYVGQPVTEHMIQVATKVVARSPHIVIRKME